jgi:hypothetical protein
MDRGGGECGQRIINLNGRVGGGKSEWSGGRARRQGAADGVYEARLGMTVVVIFGQRVNEDRDWS